MSVMPKNKNRTDKIWGETLKVILEDCGNKCEFCGAKNHTFDKSGRQVVLAIVIKDTTQENLTRDNLRALCQKCHNIFNAKKRLEARRKKLEGGQYGKEHKG
ncbi:MAG: hypothetical protein LBU88_00250 [Treponema sp.]|jgi:5-methylcytosine-specific restriction endonuclease McrA|nr:hypothetical protein [Treponema sp.]